MLLIGDGEDKEASPDEDFAKVIGVAGVVPETGGDEGLGVLDFKDKFLEVS